MKSSIIQKIIFNISNYLKCLIYYQTIKKKRVLNFYICYLCYKCYLNKLIWIYYIKYPLIYSLTQSLFFYLLFILSLNLGRLSLQWFTIDRSENPFFTT